MVFLFLNMLGNDAMKLGFFHNLISAPLTPSVKKAAAESAAPDDPSEKSNKEHVYQIHLFFFFFLLSHLTSKCLCDAS